MRKIPTPEQINAALDGAGNFMHGVAYNTTFSGSQRLFSDIMRKKPVIGAELLGRALSGLAIAVAEILADRKPK